jgi:hypothetical protein
MPQRHLVEGDERRATHTRIRGVERREEWFRESGLDERVDHGVLRRAVGCPRAGGQDRRDGVAPPDAAEPLGGHACDATVGIAQERGEPRDRRPVPADRGDVRRRVPHGGVGVAEGAPHHRAGSLAVDARKRPDGFQPGDR